MKSSIRLLIASVFLCIYAAQPNAARAQDTAPLVTLDVRAGFDGYFREHQWLPVYVQLSNEGAGVTGHLTVRPQTSGAGISGPFATEIELPAGARQGAVLYISASANVTQIRVELIDDAGVVVATAPAGLRPIQVQDRLAIVISDSVGGTVDLSSVKVGAFNGYQANLTLDALPDRPGLLDAVDLLLLSDVDTGALTRTQLTALQDWTANGGHLIVAGGANWLATAAGVTDMLPMLPDNTESVDNLRALAAWMGSSDTLSGQTLVATGRLTAEGRALIRSADSTPLFARRTYGAGVVDYLPADPMAAPMRGWAQMPEFWYAVVSSVDPQPSWGYGFNDWPDAVSAVEILPGLDLIPDVLPICGFLFLYIALIGPLNYLILNRLNRRELAWLTIPVLIALFSLLAYVLGSNLRGNEATLSRLTVVRSWPDVEQARADAVVGLLSPRRAQYDFAMPAATLRPIPLVRQIGRRILAPNTQLGIEINQGEEFSAQAFTVDASFLGEFTAAATLPRPDVSGQASIVDDGTIPGQQIVRGAVVNDADFSLDDPVILARGTAMRLEGALEPGDVVDFELTLPGEDSAAPVLYNPFPSEFASPMNPALARLISEQSIIDLLGEERYITNPNALLLDDSAEGKESLRRQLFLSSFVRDVFSASGRGSGVYLAGWTNVSPLENVLNGAEWRPQDSTLYLIELQTERVRREDSILISADQFGWVVRSFNSIGEVAPVELRLDQNDEIIFRFTPLADAVLDSVEEIYIILDGFSTGSRSFPLSLWDWELEAWVELRANSERFLVPDHERFIGPENAVEIRLRSEENGGFMRVGRLAVEQAGRFDA